MKKRFMTKQLEIVLKEIHDKANLRVLRTEE